MPTTRIGSQLILDGTVNRDDLDIVTVGKSVITKALVNSTLSIAAFTGADSGTGDVTLGLNLGNANTWTALQTFNSGILANQTGLSAKSATSFTLTLKPDEVLSANRTLNIRTVDGSRVFSLGTDLYIDGGTNNAIIAYNSGIGRYLTTASPTIGSPTISTMLTISDGVDVIIQAGTGTKIGGSSSKIGFFGNTPIVKPSGNIITALSNLGLVASGSVLSTDLSDTVGVAKGGTGATSISANKMLIAQSANTYVEATAKTIASTTYSPTSSIAWTAGAAPSGTLTGTWRSTQIIDVVYARITFSYVTAGTTVTSVTFDLPSGLPSPEEPSGFTGTNNRVGVGFGGLATANTADQGLTRVAIAKNAASSTGYSVSVDIASSTVKTMDIFLVYFTASGI